MFKTIQACEERLEVVQAEMAKLKLEENFIYEMMNLLNNTPSPSKVTRAATASDIRRIITDNPGISTVDIQKHLVDEGLGMNPRKLTYQITNLRQRDHVENRGMRGQGNARWYIKE